MKLVGKNKKHYDEGRLASIPIYRVMSERRLVQERDNVVKQIEIAEANIPEYRLRYNYDYHRNIMALKELEYLISINSDSINLCSKPKYKLVRNSKITAIMSREEMDKKDKRVAELRYICDKLETLSSDDVDKYGDIYISRFLYRYSSKKLTRPEFEAKVARLVRINGVHKLSTVLHRKYGYTCNVNRNDEYLNNLFSIY